MSKEEARKAINENRFAEFVAGKTVANKAVKKVAKKPAKKAK